MSKRKQVSAEEKRTRMLDLFHEKKDFYQLKVNINNYALKNDYFDKDIFHIY